MTDSVISSCGNKIELFKTQENSKVLIVGVFHGDEPQGNYLIKKYIQQKPDSKLMFIPCLNPDGMDKKNRCNSNGVDLNRNFKTQNWEQSDYGDYYGGREPESEIETKFIVSMVHKYSPKLILTLHAPYKIVNYDGDAKEIAEKISKIINYPLQEDIGYPTPGSFGTWAGIEQNIPTITLELDEEVEVNKLEKPVFSIFNMLEEY